MKRRIQNNVIVYQKEEYLIKEDLNTLINKKKQPWFLPRFF